MKAKMAGKLWAALRFFEETVPVSGGGETSWRTTGEIGMKGKIQSE